MYSTLDGRLHKVTVQCVTTVSPCIILPWLNVKKRNSWRVVIIQVVARLFISLLVRNFRTFFRNCWSASSPSPSAVWAAFSPLQLIDTIFVNFITFSLSSEYCFILFFNPQYDRRFSWRVVIVAWEPFQHLNY